MKKKNEETVADNKLPRVELSCSKLSHSELAKGSCPTADWPPQFGCGKLVVHSVPFHFWDVSRTPIFSLWASFLMSHSSPGCVSSPKVIPIYHYSIPTEIESCKSWYSLHYSLDAKANLWRERIETFMPLDFGVGGDFWKSHRLPRKEAKRSLKKSTRSWLSLYYLGHIMGRPRFCCWKK